MYRRNHYWPNLRPNTADPKESKNSMKNKNRKAFITGVTGQDGSWLADLLLEKGYEVHGMVRRSSSFNTGRVDHIYQDPHEKGRRFFLHYGDLSDSSGLFKLLSQVRPSEIYHLGAQSHVRSEEHTSEL